MNVTIGNSLRTAAGSLILGLFLASPGAFAGTTYCDEGCTPGYWKVVQHHDSWPASYDPGDNLQSYFGANAFNDTLLNALNYGGGPGIDGAKSILLRAAVAALLNAASGGVDFGLSVGSVSSLTTAALNSGDRGDMLELAADLDALNNQGCPLN